MVDNKDIIIRFAHYHNTMITSNSNDNNINNNEVTVAVVNASSNDNSNIINYSILNHG